LTEYIKNLEENFTRKKISIKDLRKTFIKTEDIVSKLDRSLNFMHSFDIFIAISGIMLRIYFTIIGSQIEVIKSLSLSFIFTSISIIFLLVMNFWIHGSVYDEIDNLFSLLNKLDLSMNTMSEYDFREALYFKTQANNTRLGFTIAGLIPFRKTILLSVSFI
jgi:hypothetical protein